MSIFSCTNGEDFDLRLNEKGGISLVKGQEEIRQLIHHRIWFTKGEWFLDVTDGTPWFENIWGKVKDLKLVRVIFVQRIGETEGIASLNELDIQIINRELVVNFEATTENESLLQGGEIRIPING